MNRNMGLIILIICVISEVTKMLPCSVKDRTRQFLDVCSVFDCVWGEFFAALKAPAVLGKAELSNFFLEAEDSYVDALDC